VSSAGRSGGAAGGGEVGPAGGGQDGQAAGGRRLISSGGPWEEIAGYSRAVIVGDDCWVSGTTDAGPDGVSLHPGDAVGQAREAFHRIEAALAEGGFARADIVRIRIFVTDLSAAGGLLALMGELFHDIRPAATLVRVVELIQPTLMVEIEADARRVPG
jgi:enamine deaminase RidA (YjgF/YER057c/UK114 family)